MDGTIRGKLDVDLRGIRENLRGKYYFIEIVFAFVYIPLLMIKLFISSRFLRSVAYRKFTRMVYGVIRKNKNPTACMCIPCNKEEIPTHKR